MAHMTNNPYINKDNIMIYFDKFAEVLLDKYRHEIGEMNILVVGGSALALKYAFRGTVDIDTDIRFNHSVSGSINKVADYYKIPRDWINQDFMKSESYSRRLWYNAIKLGTIRGFMNIYVVSDIDQLCMKITSGRQKDFKDIVMLVYKVKQQWGSYDDVVNRYKYLYGDAVKPKKVINNVRRMFTVPGVMQAACMYYGIK